MVNIPKWLASAPYPATVSAKEDVGHDAEDEMQMLAGLGESDGEWVSATGHACQ